VESLAGVVEDARGEPVTPIVGLGAFAETLVVHEHSLAKVRPDMPLDVAAVIGCAITTGVGAAVHTAKVEPGSSAAVVGCGGIGLATVQGAHIAGASPIIAIDIAPEKLERARSLGASDVIDATSGNVVEAVRSLTGGGVD
jgi:S-(hydroxymethyl)glutathione dehydrogenase/alcohol dehydrogenase